MEENLIVMDVLQHLIWGKLAIMLEGKFKELFEEPTWLETSS